MISFFGNRLPVKPVIKNHIFQFFKHIFITDYLGDSWVDNITFIMTKSKT
jgi:hypothetical protein